MRAILDLLPIGIGVALVAALAWFLLDRDIGAGKWLLAGLLLAHTPGAPDVRLTGWWTGLILGGAAASTLMLILFFSPALLLGFVINAALWWLVLASVWSPLAAGAMG